MIKFGPILTKSDDILNSVNISESFQASLLIQLSRIL